MSLIISRSERLDLWKEIEHQLEVRHYEPSSGKRCQLKQVMKYVFDEDRCIRGRLALAVDYPLGESMHKMVGITLEAIQGYLHNFDEEVRKVSQPRIERLAERSRKATINYGDRPKIPRHYRRIESA